MTSRILRSALSALCLVTCLWLGWLNARAGLARLYYSSADAETLLSDRAVRLSPGDPDAHYSRASALVESGRFSEAVREYEKAVTLRPRDFYLWLELGYARVQNDDDAAAHLAYLNAVRLAPRYAQPHWRLGEFLLRTGAREETFKEFRSAATSNPALLADLIELAWKEYGDDGKAVEQVVRPQSSSETLALARTFLRHKHQPEAMRLFRQAGGTAEPERRQLLAELLAELIEARQFTEAYEVWSAGRKETAKTSPAAIANIIDEGFEGELEHESLGFGWQVAQLSEKIAASRDTKDPHSGNFSLRLDFNGASAPEANIVTQMLIVAPNTQYHLEFAARARDLITGGLPFVAILGAANRQILAQSKPVPENTTGWDNYGVEFTASTSTQAVIIAIRREPCSTSPCPAFGSVWFDSFHMKSP